MRSLVVAMVFVLGAAWCVQAAVPLTYRTDPDAFPYDEGSWKKPLDQKEQEIHEMVLKRHNMEGLYPTQVTVEDDEANYTTSGHADISHSVNWTIYMMKAEMYRWLVTQDPEHLERAEEVFWAVHRCHEVNGVDGLISRGYIYGHGPTYEERRGHQRGQDIWYQGQGEYANYRFRGSTSHHNHSGYFMGMGFAWRHFENSEIKEAIRDVTDKIANRVFIENDGTVINYDGSEGPTLVGRGGRSNRPTMSNLMATSELKVAAVVTGKQAYADMYEDLVEKYKYREYADLPVEDLLESIGGRGYDDPDHCFNHLENMMEMEEDETLLRFYRKFSEALWEVHKDDRQAFYNMLHGEVIDEKVKPEDVVWYLNGYPTNRIFQPVMNSVRDDFEELPQPRPLYDRPADNEWDFKGDPFNQDGWISRFVMDVDVFPADPMVMFACDEGGFIYRSFDGGQTWADSFRGLGGAMVRAVLCSPVERELVLAATDRGLYRSRDAGYSWTHLVGESASDLMRDPNSDQIAYAIVDGKPYESVPYDDYHWGMNWRPTGGETPPYGLDRIYLLTENGQVTFVGQDQRNSLWKTHPGDNAWEYLVYFFSGRSDLSGITGYGDRMIGYSERYNSLAMSTDGGKEWRPIGRIYWYGEGSGLGAKQILDVALDPNNPDIIYVAGERDIWISRDGGANWETVENPGLMIPVAGSIIPDPVTGKVYAGSRAGLFNTSDQGVTWSPNYLVSQFEGLQRIETGLVEYLVVYWMGRHLGYLSEEQVEAEWAPVD